MIITLENEVIAGPDGEGHSGLKVNGRQIVQESEFLRAKSIELFNRGNQRTSFTFVTHKKFADKCDAEVWFLERYPLLLSLCGVLTLTAKSETKEANRWIKKAAVVNLSIGELGVSLDLNWEIHGGQILTEKPTK